MHINYNEVGKRIAKRRKELGLKQFEVTELAGLSDKYLSNIERATSILSIDVLMKLCTVLKVTPDYFLLGVTNDCSPENYEAYLKQNFAKLSEKQKKLALGFIEWISEQDI